MTEQTADIRLQIRVRNARVLRAMEALGITTVADLCRLMGHPKSGTMQGVVGKLINFKTKPIEQTGVWKPRAIEIATALHREPDELWPEYLRVVEARKTETHLDLTVEQFGAIVDGRAGLEARQVVDKALKFLPPQWATILELRYGLNGNGVHTLREIADLYGFTHSNAGRIEKTALEKLRTHLEVAEKYGEEI